MSKSEKMLAVRRFLPKMCVYLKHFCYLCIEIKSICIVTFAEDNIRNNRFRSVAALMSPAQAESSPVRNLF